MIPIHTNVPPSYPYNIPINSPQKMVVNKSGNSGFLQFRDEALNFTVFDFEELLHFLYFEL
jgi:hypothetical protein